MRVQAHGRPSMKLEHQEIAADRRHALGVTRVSSVASGARCAVMSVWCSGRAVDPARQAGPEDIEILIPGDPEACTMVIALDRAYFERKAREVLGGEAVTTAEIPPRVERYAAAADPLMREIGNALRSEVHSRRRPNAAYLECMAAMVAIHLAKTYCGGAPALPPCPGLPPHKLARVQSFINAHLAEGLRLKQLAGVVHMSTFHFSRMFKQATGRSPHAYLTELRVEQAKRLLTESTLPLIEVAARVGFQTQGHFTGVFHRHTGLTPRVFRMNCPARHTAEASSDSAPQRRARA